MPNLLPPLEVYSYPPVPGKNKVTPHYDYQEYPAGMHNSNGRNCVANDADHQAMLETQGWSRQPFPEPEKKLETCPNCDRLKAKFESAWQEFLAEHKTLEAEHKAVQEALGALEAEQKAQQEDRSLADTEHAELAMALHSKLTAFEASNKELLDKCAAFEAQLNAKPVEAPAEEKKTKK